MLFSADVHYMISDFTIAFRRIWGYAPIWLSNFMISFPKKDLQRMNYYSKVVRKVAKGLVAQQMEAHAAGKEGGKDVMSIFSEPKHH
jgi:hypothetical protein